MGFKDSEDERQVRNEDKKFKFKAPFSKDGRKVNPNDGSNDSIPENKLKGGLNGSQNALQGMPSMHSTNVSSMNAKYPTARELSEQFGSKLFEMKWVWISFVVNAVLLYYLREMGNGVVLEISISTLETFGTVAIELLLLIANIITFHALNDGAAALFGYRLASKHGYSLAVCGFMQASSIGKWTFCNELSLNSTCRKLLTRITIIWVILDFLKILTPLSATALIKEQLRIDSGTIDCFLFEIDDKLQDRQWPTINSTAGFAELIFGTALGEVRSEFPLNVTRQVMAPQIVGAVQDGDTIAGNGTGIDILTSCGCSAGTNYTNVMEVNAELSNVELSNDNAIAMYAQFKDMSGLGFVNYITDPTDTGFNMTTMIHGSPICGDDDFHIPVCVTRFFNHTKLDVEIRYMTDGTPASIAAEAVFIRKLHENLTDFNAPHFALKTILGGQISSFEMFATIPGVMNPLLWWTTPNLLATDPALLDAGLETTFTMLIRAGMQRTYDIKGSTCVKNVADEGKSKLTMRDYGVTVSTVILAYQLACSCIAVLCFIPWLFVSDPIGPSVRILKEEIYFNTLVHTSSINSGFWELCNAPQHMIWQALDIIMRVGETIQTTAEDVGHVACDKPKLIANFQNGRKYY